MGGVLGVMSGDPWPDSRSSIEAPPDVFQLDLGLTPNAQAGLAANGRREPLAAEQQGAHPNPVFLDKSFDRF
jgi:hypothetical protein